MSGGYKWKPLARAVINGPRNEDMIRRYMTTAGVDRDTAIKTLNDYDANSEYWINDLYQVQLRRLPDNIVHLNIRRRDGNAILRDWRHFQQIKNELVGPECEAIELFPAESRKVDASNKYHLWVVADPTFRFPVGFDDRDVDYSTDTNHRPGMRQRPESIRTESHHAFSKAHREAIAAGATGDEAHAAGVKAQQETMRGEGGEQPFQQADARGDGADFS